MKIMKFSEWVGFVVGGAGSLFLNGWEVTVIALAIVAPIAMEFTRITLRYTK